MSDIGHTAIICLSPYYGGMELDAVQLATLFRTYQIPVSMIVRQGSPLALRHTPALQQSGVHVREIPFRTSFSISLIRGLRQELVSKNTTNVVFFGASEIKSIYFSLLGLPVNFIVRHGTHKTSSKKDALHRLLYSRVDWHVAICRRLADNVRQIIPMGPHSRVAVVYSSISCMGGSRLPTPPGNDNPLRILHVGRIAGGKGHLAILNACKALQEKGIRFELHLAGAIDPSFEETFAEALDRSPFRDSIFIHGHVPNPGALYERSHIFLFPSDGEGLGKAFMEALSFGLWCIAYDNTSFPEFKELGFEFDLVPNQNLELLADALVRAATSGTLDRIPLVHNIELARRTFTPDIEAAGYMNILK